MLHSKIGIKKCRWLDWIFNSNQENQRIGVQKSFSRAKVLRSLSNTDVDYIHLSVGALWLTGRQTQSRVISGSRDYIWLDSNQYLAHHRVWFSQVLRDANNPIFISRLTQKRRRIPFRMRQLQCPQHLRIWVNRMSCELNGRRFSSPQSSAGVRLNGVLVL